jgi:hypothetical protein
VADRVVKDLVVDG